MDVMAHYSLETMSDALFRRCLLAAALCLSCLIGAPFFFATQHPLYRGLMPFRTQDDASYINHIQTALLGRYAETSNGITSPTPHVDAAGPATVELFSGAALSWTGLRGPEVSVLLLILFGPLIVVFLPLLLKELGVGNKMALLASLAYVLPFFGGTARPVNPSFTIPLCLCTLWLILRTIRAPNLFSFTLSILLLSVLPVIHFWVWTFTWTAVACLLVAECFSGAPDVAGRRRSWILVAIGGGGLLLSIPLLVKQWVVKTANPFFLETALFRSGVYPTHAIESPIRSGMLFILVICAFLIYRSSRNKVFAAPAAFCLAIFLVLHQNVIHGRDFLFSSHYYPFVCLAAVLFSAVLIERRSWNTVHLQLPTALALSVTTVFLLAAAWDYRDGWKFFVTYPESLTQQHLAPVLNQLNDGKRQTILTDAQTALYVKSWTDDDVIFTPYVQHLLVSNAEFAERGCMSEFSSPEGADVSMLAWHTLQYRGAFMLPERTSQFNAVCKNLLKNPSFALRRYPAQLLLWNERMRPTWKINTNFFTKLSQGDGWSLWLVRA